MGRAKNINPAILKWARDSARLSTEEAANRIGFTSSDKVSAAEKLERLEVGDEYPTRNQLLKIASVYRRPLTTFYLREPPRTGERGEDFRTLPAVVSPRDNLLLDSLLRDMRARQEMVRGLLEDEDEATPRPYVGSVSLTDGVASVAGSISQTLGFDPPPCGITASAMRVRGRPRCRVARARRSGVVNPSARKHWKSGIH